jgi:hypothetical protein
MATAESNFSIIDFADTLNGKTLTELVPRSWLHNDEGQSFCWWPPKDAAQAVKKQWTPDTETWNDYLVHKVLYDYGEFFWLQL